MKYIESPDYYSKTDKMAIFLAGGITDCTDWQLEMVNLLKDLDIILLNPRRKNFRDKYNSFIKKLHAGKAEKTDLFVVSPEKAINSLSIIGSFKSISIWPFYFAIIAMIIVIRNVL